MENIYSTQKINYHPKILQQLKDGKQTYPIQMHLMPNDSCNMNCNFCSYRLEGNKNTELFDKKSNIPLNIMKKTINDFSIMGGRAIEVTGSGEPLLYPHKEDFILTST